MRFLHQNDKSAVQLIYIQQKLIQLQVNIYKYI
jgi:hypothetical protein